MKCPKPKSLLYEYSLLFNELGTSDLSSYSSLMDNYIGAEFVTVNCTPSNDISVTKDVLSYYVLIKLGCCILNMKNIELQRTIGNRKTSLGQHGIGPALVNWCIENLRKNCA